MHNSSARLTSTLRTVQCGDGEHSFYLYLIYTVLTFAVSTGRPFALAARDAARDFLFFLAGGAVPRVFHWVAVAAGERLPPAPATAVTAVACDSPQCGLASWVGSRAAEAGLPVRPCSKCHH